MATDKFGSSSKQIVSVQYLRAIAALAVTYHHTFENHTASPLKSNAFGVFGVDVFFVLSGFIMWVTTSDTKTEARPFLIKRIIRIYPIYWMALTIWIASRFIVHDSLNNADVSPSTVELSYLLFPHYHLVFASRIWPILIPGWTLQYELFFYFVFGLCLFIRSNMLRLITLITILTSLISTGVILAPTNAVLSICSNPLLLEFVGGVLVGVAFRASLTLPHWSAAAIILISFVLLIAAESFFGESLRWIFLGVPALATVFGAVSLEAAAAHKPNHLITMLGDSSYSLYLFHPIVISAFAVVVARICEGINPAIFILLAVIASVAASVVIHVFVERPVVDALRSAVSARARPPKYRPSDAVEFSEAKKE